ncbi:hypothetical protein K4L44_14475 [Halosquirtibacter laminarini]|uniref:Uncharacterized protein n=1 Tax=Halosquirtibacter laminarini TaxID=3374600 RepID=A0AC61NDZ8_9BACT|nr:hypothetical protein K4L44_14475 [Prolixibacteraceae bacterium]
MYRRLRHIYPLLLMWCFCNVSTKVWGQESLYLYEGEIQSFSMDEVVDRSYNWTLYAGYSMISTASSSDEAKFLGSSKLSVASCMFMKQGKYVLRIDTEEAGCLNSRITMVQVIVNDMNLGFTVSDREACSTSFEDEVPLLIPIKKHIEPKSTHFKSYYPLRVKVRMSDSGSEVRTQEILVEHDATELVIKFPKSDFETDHEYVVDILGVTTQNGLPVAVDASKRRATFLVKKRPRAGKITIVE